MSKKYWKGIEELKQTPEFIKQKDQEFPSQQSVEDFLADENLAESSTARRDFLKFLGFSVAAATLAACEAPVTKVVPYVVKPENVTPGMPTWYASTYYDGASYASIVVKTREGRPILRWYQPPNYCLRFRSLRFCSFGPATCKRSKGELVNRRYSN
ncbi:MAG: TAT-variant-translocated molybdopterin oxidoreductase [Cryomorphaceae bacterium]|nr:TAT-variant-translocated molybdopterin oxidoreductase [Cryomorphaceae bacterium]